MRVRARTVLHMPNRTQRASEVLRLDPNKIVARRVELGLLQKDVANRAGISPQFMADIECGRRAGSPPVRLAIAKALKTHLRHLVTENVFTANADKTA